MLCGLFVDPDQPCLCSSPHGLIGENGLLEIKCPWSVERLKLTPQAAIIDDRINKYSYCLKQKYGSTNDYELKRNHQFYHRPISLTWTASSTWPPCICVSTGPTIKKGWVREPPASHSSLPAALLQSLKTNSKLPLTVDQAMQPTKTGRERSPDESHFRSPSALFPQCSSWQSM